MAVQVSYPGVYIEEFAPGAPIQGVGTNTAAFIGVATGGDLNSPTKLTSWDQFRAIFGDQPAPGFYLWYAVRGFFQNGGQVCYVVRASNGDYDRATLNNRGGAAMLSVRARRPGQLSPALTAQVTAATPAVSGAIYQPTGTFSSVSGRNVQLQSAAEAAQFRPSDWVTLAAAGERVQVAGVAGDTVRLAGDLMQSYTTPGAFRLADAPAGTRVVRLQVTGQLQPGTLVPGLMLTVTQGQTDSQIVESVQNELLLTSPTPITTYRITFRQGLGIPLSMTTTATVQSEELNLAIRQGTGTTITYPNLSIDPAHPRYLVDFVNNQPDGLIVLQPIEPPPAAVPPNNLPVVMTNPATLSGGANEDPTTLTDAAFSTALDTLRGYDDVNLVAAPDATRLSSTQTAAFQQAAIVHCEQLADRFAVLDARAGLPLYGASGVEGQRRGLDSTRGFAGLYYPWLRVQPATAGPPVLVPPSGQVCGIVARSDSTRGVHKAPANEVVNGAVGIERSMSDIDQGQLNLQGINVIRQFQAGGRPLLWGARTTATDTNWQYVNIRRLFLYLEKSIQEGIRWAVFEPNDLGLWEKLRRTLSDFLTRVWRDGGLFGATAKDAFYVRIDETLNPDSVRALGRLYIEIGVRPAYPAEFIIVRIGIWQGGSDVAES